MKLDPANVVEGVKDAVWGWLNEHSVTAPEAVEYGVARAVTAWLDKHGDDVLTAAVARVLAEREV